MILGTLVQIVSHCSNKFLIIDMLTGQVQDLVFGSRSKIKESEIKGGSWSGEILDGAEFERGDGVQIARGEGHGELVWAEEEAVSRMVTDW